MNSSGRIDYRIAGALVLLLAVGGLVAARVTSLRKQVTDSSSAEASRLARHDPAPEFEGIKTWINSPPLTVASLRGKVVLVDFWTYSCVNCIRTLPELRAFYAAYKSAGLEIVGIHAPEFGFEKDVSNVKRAVKENEVTWPVGLDNDMKTWDAYQNQYWPHVYLIDREGSVRFDHVGEGGAEDLEKAIRTLLATKGVTVPSSANPTPYGVPSQLTPEIYLGYDRGEPTGVLGNAEGYTHDREHTYKAPPPAKIVSREAGAFYLGGAWLAKGEYIEAAEKGARILLPFNAQNVFVVAGTADGSPVEATVLVDGAPAGEATWGPAVSRGALKVEGKDLYQILHLAGVEAHTLELEFTSPGADVYTFTFG